MTGSRVDPAAPARLTTAERRAVRAVANEIAGEFATTSLHDPRLLAEVEMAAPALGPEVRRRLMDFRDRGNPEGFLVLDGMPVDDLPPTPTRVADEPDWQLLPVASIAQLMVMAVLGRVFAYADEKRGRLIQDVFPIADSADRQENSGSVHLELHTENGFHPCPPHFIGLLGLRVGDVGQGATLVGELGSAMARLSRDSVAELRKPQFRVRFSSSFVGPQGEVRYSPLMPAISGSESYAELRVDFHASEAMTDRGEEALADLENAMTASTREVRLGPGDMVVVDNRRAVHGRTEFTPRYDGRDRWLRRCFAVSDLRLIAGNIGPGRQYAAVTHGAAGTVPPGGAIRVPS